MTPPTRFPRLNLSASLTALLLAALTAGPAHAQLLRVEQDGLITYVIPEDWAAQQQQVRATHADRLRLQGVAATAADEEALETSLNFFLKHNHEEGTAFDPATAEVHELHVELHTYYGAFSRWVWANGWCFGEPAIPFVNATTICRAVNNQMELVERFAPGDDRMPFDHGSGAVFRRADQGTYQLDFQYYYYNVVVGNTCYQIRIGGLERDFDTHWPQYEQILKSVTFPTAP